MSTRSMAVSKDRARAILGQQESIGKLGKRIQMLLKKSPAESKVLAKEVYRELRTHNMDSDVLIAAVKKMESEQGPFVPKLNMGKPKQSAPPGPW